MVLEGHARRVDTLRPWSTLRKAFHVRFWVQQSNDGRGRPNAQERGLADSSEEGLRKLFPEVGAGVRWSWVPARKPHMQAVKILFLGKQGEDM